MSAQSRGQKPSKEERQDLAKQLRIVAAVSVLGAATVGLLVAWEQWSSVPPEQLVKVYRVHGCRCVFEWVKSLEAEGYTVKLLEIESLQNVRASLRTPEYLGGCHVAGYLDYFVEGHVAPKALHKLADEHPQALGVVAQATAKTAAHPNANRDENGPVFLVGADGKSLLWYSPKG